MGYCSLKQLLASIVVFFVLSNLCAPSLGKGKIGVDYGLNGNNLLPPKKTVALVQSKGITRVRIYETRQDVVQDFENSGIELLIGIPNELVPKIAGNLAEAFNWITQNVVSHPSSNITAIIVGNEWLLDTSRDSSLLLPAMLNIYTVLKTLQMNINIKVSTSHALNVLERSFPPSLAAFRGELLSVLQPLVQFLEQTGSFFMINIMPYFAYIQDSNVSLELALFEASAKAVQDPYTGLQYTNLFDLQLDAVYFALGTLRFEEAKAGAKRSTHRVIVGESGWPSGPGSSGSVPHSTISMKGTRKGLPADPLTAAMYTCKGRECIAQTVDNARTYNQNLVRHVFCSRGTPANPTTPIEAFIFEIFDENLKPDGPEQHYGLFHPDGSPVYPITFQ